MKKQIVLALAVCGILPTLQARATVISDWTFETSQPAGGATGAFGSYAPEVGVGTMSAYHASASIYTSPAGNGSAHSFSSTNWSVGDFYQAQVNVSSVPGATSLSSITISYDQTSSTTGPKYWNFQYSTDGSTYTTFLSSYIAYTNTGSGLTWTSTTSQPGSTITADLSSITSLDTASTIYFRITDASTSAENGGTVGTSGTDRIDNFTINADVVPEPSPIALLGLGAGALVAFRRRK